jgi:hypothetical protein
MFSWFWRKLFVDLSLKLGVSIGRLTLYCNMFLMTYAELPENVKCMMDCEAVDILQGIKDQMVILSRDPEFRLPV